MTTVYDALTDRDDAGALMPEDAAQEIIADLPKQSVVLDTFRRIPVSRKQKRIPALGAFPTAYVVGSDTGLKQTTYAKWDNRYVNIEEIAVLAPIPDAVIDDAKTGGYNLWGMLQPYLVEAIARKVDSLVFFGGDDKPATWPDAIVDGCSTAGNTYNIGTADAAGGGIAEDISQLWALVEADGYDVGFNVAERVFRARLRGARATDGQRLLDVSNNTVDGVPLSFAMDGQWDTGVHMFALDPREFIAGVRSDISVKKFDSGVISDGDGKVLLNLIQQDSQLVRVTFRFGWTVAATLKHANADDEDSYGAAVLITEGALDS